MDNCQETCEIDEPVDSPPILPQPDFPAICGCDRHGQQDEQRHQTKPDILALDDRLGSQWKIESVIQAKENQEMGRSIIE